MERSAAPGCGACAPLLTCPAIFACSCAGAGGRVPVPACEEVVPVYAVALDVLVEGLRFEGLAGGQAGLPGLARPPPPRSMQTMPHMLYWTLVMY